LDLRNADLRNTDRRSLLVATNLTGTTMPVLLPS
jgi:hypothetical protein